MISGKNFLSTGKNRVSNSVIEILPARYIIHTVGPVWNGGRNECELLAMCYRNSLSLAEKYNIEKLSFPSISTGAYGFPIQTASQIAVKEISTFIKTQTTIKQVFIITFSSRDTDVYTSALRNCVIH
jgi:O-acetyl-ADP-ribose deacetylase